MIKIKYRFYVLFRNEKTKYIRFSILSINSEKTHFVENLDKKNPSFDIEIDIDYMFKDFMTSFAIAIDVGWQLVGYLYSNYNSTFQLFDININQIIIKDFVPNVDHINLISPA